jgi:hypothetical protein
MPLFINPWLTSQTIGRIDARAIVQHPGADQSLPLLDNALLLDFGRDAVVKYNAAGRPAFALFREWVRANYPSVTKV